MNFKEAILDVANKFKKTTNPIRIVSNFDADGITAAAILVKAMQRLNKSFSLSIIKQLTENHLKELSAEDYKTIVIADMGSGSLSLIDKYLKGKTVFVLDHHQMENFENIGFNLLNPLMHGISNYKEISASGVCYLFAKALNEENKDLAHLAIIGAIGDIQEDNGFIGLNKEILEDAKEKIEVKKGLKMFGHQTKPLHKLLMFSTDPYIPGVSGNESGTLKFLSDLGINIRADGKFRKLINLGKEELKKLTSAIIIRRFENEGENPEDVLGDIYLLKDEEEGSSIKDAREFATLLNASGRLNKSYIGVGVCLNNNKMKTEAIEMLDSYKSEIVKYLNWFYDNKDNFDYGNFVLINAKDNIKDVFIGVIMSIISRSNIYKEGTLLIGMAHGNNEIKISSRCSGKGNKNLNELMLKLTSTVGGSAGGHYSAAGGFISLDKEEEFIKHTKKLLSA